MKLNVAALTPDRWCDLEALLMPEAVRSLVAAGAWPTAAAARASQCHPG